MRRFRLFSLLVLLATVLSATACTNPTGPKPAGEDLTTTKI